MVRFRPGGKGKVLNLMRTIPWSSGENQMKLDQMIGRISQVWRFGDMSDEILDLANVAIDNRNQTNPGVVGGIR
jgi:hypothetical protein